ncbi:MAG TPA: sigma-70 family RNA polymerase sigma factor [Planctomycetota bacterium]
MGESAAEDLALVRRTLAGDRQAFDPLVRRHQKSVYAVVYGILRSASDAEDATQDVFLRAFRYLPSYDPSRSFEGWLMAIAVNQARGLRQSRRGEARVDPSSLAAGRAPEGNPELREAALRAIDGLPERQRDAMLLFLNSELTLDQIGDALGCSKGTVGAHLHRARAALKKALGRWVS